MKQTKKDHIDMAVDLKAVCNARCLRLEAEGLFEYGCPVDVIAVMREHIEVLGHWDELNKRGEKLKMPSDR
jgi:hypothetical protein